MALKFQFNKTFLHQLNKDLKVRVNALPTLQAKEAALRLEVKAAKAEGARLEADLASRKAGLAQIERLWPEFPFELVNVAEVRVGLKKYAGVKTPVLEAVRFEEKEPGLFSSPAWTLQGVALLKSVFELEIKIDVARKKLAILEYARKKTTQKVNLYEKVQIPEYKDAIRRIKRYLEDEDNLAKSSQKILKSWLLAAEEVAA